MGISGSGKEDLCGLGQVNQFLCASIYSKVILVTVFYMGSCENQMSEYMESA